VVNASSDASGKIPQVREKRVLFYARPMRGAAKESGLKQLNPVLMALADRLAPDEAFQRLADLIMNGLLGGPHFRTLAASLVPLLQPQREQDASNDDDELHCPVANTPLLVGRKPA
jgi:hypothetical protein